jgi:hypothetical protein
MINQTTIADFVPAPVRLASAVAALEFIFAGNAYFTVRSLKTGTRYTFRVAEAKRDENNNWKKMWFVSLLAGPKNTSDYVYLGAIRDDVFRLTRASKMNEDSTPVKAFRWVFEALQRGGMPHNCEIWHEGRCGRCGRMLTVPESIERGIGPECAGRMGL